MPAPRKFLLLALLLAPLPAVALQKCVAPDGKVSYSEQPCATGSKPAAMGRGAPGAPGTPHVPSAEVKVDYYEVQGADYNAVLGSMMSGRPFAGRTNWNLSYQYQSRTQAGACTPESVTIKLELSMTMPRWSPPSGAPAELVGRWERFNSALRAHEDGQVSGARNMESAARRALLTLSAANCGALDAAMRARFEQILEQGRAYDRDYDAQTGHGKTQGAVFR